MCFAGRPQMDPFLGPIAAQLAIRPDRQRRLVGRTDRLPGQHPLRRGQGGDGHALPPSASGGRSLGIKANVVCPGYVDTEIFHVSPVVHADKNRLQKRRPFKMISAEAAAKTILAGVAKNKPSTVFPVTPACSGGCIASIPAPSPLGPQSQLEAFARQAASVGCRSLSLTRGKIVRIT